MARKFRIFPSIGVARIGDSPSDYYIGPEAPQLDFVPSNGNRDTNCCIKRMAARFRVYEFDEDTPVREVTQNDLDIEYIEWEVHLANTKATKQCLNEGVLRRNLEIDTGTVTLSVEDQSKPMFGSLGVTVPTTRVHLGDLKWDGAGRLLVLGGHGKADSWSNASVDVIQNDGWYDDTSDGPVRARVKVKNEEFPVKATSAWVIVGPPDFAHGIECIVTLYDVARDLAGPFLFRPYDVNVSFVKNIYPILRRTVYLQWTNAKARNSHGGSGFGNFLDPTIFKLMHNTSSTEADVARNMVFKRLKNPTDQIDSGNMPDLDDLTLTPTQYRCFEEWAKGNFIDDWDSNWNPIAPPTRVFSDIPVKEQPDALTRAALEACVGGSFNPGIEVGDTAAQHATYQQPFRISRTIRPGGLTRNLGVPWQADFNMCVEIWWPSARPDSVLDSNTSQVSPLVWDRDVRDNMDMIDKWRKLGFVVPDTTTQNVRYVEKLK